MKIRNVLDYDRMKEFLNAPMDWYDQFGKKQQTPDGRLIVNDIGANILAVAHLDSVNDYDHFHVNEFAGREILFNTHLDDRLGAYLILDVLPKLGIHTDVILTEGEEVGKSTARYFQTNKQYKWMFSFDRRGTDVVYYRYYVKEWLDALKNAFKEHSHGSNSDIDYLSHLKCCGMNIGTGYHDEHKLMAYAIKDEIETQLGRLMMFYQTHKRSYFEWKQPTYPATPVYKGPPPYAGQTYTTTRTETPPANPTKPPALEDDWDDFYYGREGNFCAPLIPMSKISQRTGQCDLCLPDKDVPLYEVITSADGLSELWCKECVDAHCEWCERCGDYFDIDVDHDITHGNNDNDDDEYNPYEGMVTDMPLDIHTYVNEKTGVIEAPSECAFCSTDLTPHNVHVFMGICKDCERWAVQCTECLDFYCREDDPLEDDLYNENTLNDLFYGTCSVCEEFTGKFRGNTHDTNDTGFRNFSEWDGDQSNNEGDQDAPVG